MLRSPQDARAQLGDILPASLEFLRCAWVMHGFWWAWHGRAAAVIYSPTCSQNSPPTLHHPPILHRSFDPNYADDDMDEEEEGSDMEAEAGSDDEEECAGRGATGGLPGASAMLAHGCDWG